MSGEIQPTTATRFLLGELPEDERERLERHLLEDGAAGDTVAAAEDELLDDYAAGALPRRRRLAFERRLRGSASLRRRAAFARALARLGGNVAARPTVVPAGVVVPGPGLRRSFASPLTALAAAASLLLAVACGWLLWRGSTMTDRLASLETEAAVLTAERDALAARSGELDRRLAGERDAAAETETELAARNQRLAELETELERRRSAPPPAPVTASFVLSAALRSEFGSRQLELAPEVERVRLTLDIGTREDYPSYLAVITGPANREVWSQRGLSPVDGAAGTSVDLTLPATVLADGHHEALLYGEPADTGGEPELVGAFEFEPVRR